MGVKDVCDDCGEPHDPENPFEAAWNGGFEEGYDAALEHAANQKIVRKETALVTIAAAVAGNAVPAAILQAIQDLKEQKQHLTESEMEAQVKACAKIAAAAAKETLRALNIFPDLTVLAPKLLEAPVSPGAPDAN